MTARATAPAPLPCGPGPDGRDQPHWEGLRGGRLLLPRCGSCATWRFLGRTLCASCWSFETVWDEVAASGRVHSWARSHRSFMNELDVPPPYVTVLVELDDAPVRLLGVLTDTGPSRGPTIGDRVAGVIQHPANAAWPVLRWQRAVRS